MPDDTEMILKSARNGLYQPAIKYCNQLSNMHYLEWGLITSRENYNPDRAEERLLMAEGFLNVANNLPSRRGHAFHEGLLLAK